MRVRRAPSTMRTRRCQEPTWGYAASSCNGNETAFKVVLQTETVWEIIKSLTLLLLLLLLLAVSENFACLPRDFVEVKQQQPVNLLERYNSSVSERVCVCESVGEKESVGTEETFLIKQNEHFACNVHDWHVGRMEGGDLSCSFSSVQVHEIWHAHEK